MRPSAVYGLLALSVSSSLFCYFYLWHRQAFFDDVFIYLHIARNGADRGSWQYFALVDRPALLASSPLKITLLTAAAYIAKWFGWGDRSFFSAKLILVIYAPLAWLVWAPFWQKKLVPFLLLGTSYFLCTLALDATVDFEGGLLFLWVATLAMLLRDPGENARKLGWVIPLGLLIRPDVAIPVLIATAIVIGKERIGSVAGSALRRGLALAVVWVLIAVMMDVWPIPTTYWAKAAIRQLVEQRFMIEVFFERLGMATGHRIVRSPAAATALGILIVFGFLLATTRDARTRLAAAAVIPITVALLLKAPANFWWYYQNVALTMMGAAFGLLLRRDAVVPDQPFLSRSVTPIAFFALFVTAILLAGKAGQDGPSPWRMDADSRAQGYRYLASRAVGDGTYDLPDIGPVLIKNPEIGMSSFFAGDRAWIWDSAGLAQPLDDPRVARSALRHFFPRSVRRAVVEDAKSLADRHGSSLKVVEVWAMEDRDFDAARQKCRYVIVEGAICANDFPTNQ